MEDMEVAEMNLDKDELMRYLNGEIQFTEWKQGHDLIEFLSSEDNAPEPTGIEEELDEGETDDNASDESDAGEEQEEKEARVEVAEEEIDAEDDEEEDDEEEDDEEETLDDLDEEYVPPGRPVHKPKRKVGRPKKPRPEPLTPKRGRGRPRKEEGFNFRGRPSFSSSSQDDSPFAHEMRLGRAEKRQRTKRGRKKGVHNRVPKALRGLMGEAHLCFARGGHQEAIKMCLEIIRQVPRCPDPYQLLGMIYEDKQDMEKSLQFSLIAAHLNPRDTEEWTRCAEMCLEQDDINRAIHCYSKAIRYNPKDLSNHLERIHLYEQLEEKKKVLECYHVLLKALPEDEGEQYMQLAKDIVRAHHQNGDITLALDILETAFSKYSELISSEDVNMLAELHIASRQYQRALQVISDHCGVVIQSKSDNAVVNMDQLSLADRENRQDIMDVTVPDGIPIDLIAKLGVCLIHCRQFQTVKGVMSMLLSKDPNEMGDLYLDVAEAYIELGCFLEARPLLEVLVETQNYNLAAVWLRYAECLTSLGELESSANAYRQVLLKVPSHLDARIALSTIEQQRGNADKALELLSMVTEDVATDVQLVRQRSLLFYSKGLFKEFIQDGLMLLRAYVKEAYQHHGGNVSDQQLSGNLSVLGHDEWYSLYCKTLDALVKTEQLKEAETLSNAVIVSKRFTRVPGRTLVQTDLYYSGVQLIRGSVDVYLFFFNPLPILIMLSFLL